LAAIYEYTNVRKGKKERKKKKTKMCVYINTYVDTASHVITKELGTVSLGSQRARDLRQGFGAPEKPRAGPGTSASLFRPWRRSRPGRGGLGSEANKNNYFEEELPHTR